MQFDVLGDLNWLTVIVAALAYFALGGLWYAPPIFGNAWTRASGFKEPEPGQSPGVAIYLGPLITCFVATIATAMLAATTATDTISEGLVLGLVVGIGYAVAIVGTTAIFETNKPDKKTWFVITAAYHLVGLLIVSMLLALWD